MREKERKRASRRPVSILVGHVMPVPAESSVQCQGPTGRAGVTSTKPVDPGRMRRHGGALRSGLDCACDSTTPASGRPPKLTLTSGDPKGFNLEAQCKQVQNLVPGAIFVYKKGF